MSDLLRQRLARRLGDLFERHPVVVWKDPTGVMGPVLRESLPSGVEMPAFEGNPLSLRAQIDAEDPWIERRWLLYMPRLPDGVECEWLTDYEAGFCCLPQATLAWALKEFFGLAESLELRHVLDSDAAKALALQFGQYFPGDRGSLRAEDVYFALLRAAVRAPAADEVELVLRYLSSEGDVARWKEEGLLPVLTAAVKARLGLRRHLVDGHPPDRGALCRCMVASSLVETGATDAKPLFNHLPQEEFRPRWKAALERGLQDHQRREAFLASVEDALRSSDLSKALDNPMALALGPALPFVDRRIEQLLLDSRPSDEAQIHSWWENVSAVADERLRLPLLDRNARQRWSALSAAAQLCSLARRRLSELVSYPAGALERLAKEYVRSEGGDWWIDALYRKLPQLDGGLSSEWDKALLMMARQTYHQWTRTLTSRFTKAVEASGLYAVSGFLPQASFWEGLDGDSKGTAVLMVDALRADLGYELAHRLRDRGLTVETCPTLAQLPTRTEVGMAALLPRAKGQFGVKVEGGKLVSYIGARRLPGTSERSAHLESALAEAGRKVSRLEIDDFLRDGGAKLVHCAAKGMLPVAYTTELDDSGPAAAKVTFELFVEILEKCSTFVASALEAGFSRILIGSDHGFLIGSPVAAKGGVPGTAASGGLLARGLRYAAGAGEVGGELLHITAATLGRDGDDVYVPRDTSCLAIQGGPSLFVHGGLSPQECVLVSLLVKSGTVQRSYVQVRLDVPAKVIGQTFKLSVVNEPVDMPLLFAPRKVVVRIYDAGGGMVWESAELRADPHAGGPLTETLMANVPRGGPHTVALLDAATAYSIDTKALMIEVLGDDFDF